MTMNINKTALTIMGAVIGSILTVMVYSFWLEPTGNGENNGKAELEILYWVAPMDANFRRDKPGKSPMGMDLVPVYANDRTNAPDEGPGTILISPNVVNNLGVRTAIAQNRILSSVIKTVGYVGYDEDQLIHIHPRVEGWIEKLYIKAAGDPVEQGQPLYEIYSPTLVNAQEEFLLALSRNNAQLIKASEDRLRALQLPMRAIENLKKTRNVTQTITFFAPTSGVVDNLNIRQGFFVKPGTTMMSIGNLDQVWVEAEIFERQASYVSEELPVSMTVDYLPGKIWQGQVDYVHPTLDAMTRTLKVRLRFDNINGALKPNMFTQVRIDTQTGGESLTVPKNAVIRSGSSDRVILALGQGAFKSVEVEVGRIDGQFYEILSGIKSGEKVVISAQFLLDSESSKTSDFKRMNRPDNEEEMVAGPTSGWTSGTINEIDVSTRIANISHKRIEAFNMMGMTMNFMVADNVDIAKLITGMTLELEVSKGAGAMFEILNVKIDDPEIDPANWTQAVINSVDLEKRSANISHQAIKNIGMMAMTMDFNIAQTIDIASLAAGDAVFIVVERSDDGDFIVTHIKSDE